jgi:hypothetical protein
MISQAKSVRVSPVTCAARMKTCTVRTLELNASPIPRRISSLNDHKSVCSLDYDLVLACSAGVRTGIRHGKWLSCMLFTGTATVDTLQLLYNETFSIFALYFLHFVIAFLLRLQLPAARPANMKLKIKFPARLIHTDSTATPSRPMLAGRPIGTSRANESTEPATFQSAACSARHLKNGPCSRLQLLRRAAQAVLSYANSQCLSTIPSSHF